MSCLSGFTLNKSRPCAFHLSMACVGELLHQGQNIKFGKWLVRRRICNVYTHLKCMTYMPAFTSEVLSYYFIAIFIVRYCGAYVNGCHQLCVYSLLVNRKFSVFKFNALYVALWSICCVNTRWNYFRIKHLCCDRGKQANICHVIRHVPIHSKDFHEWKIVTGCCGASIIMLPCMEKQLSQYQNVSWQHCCNI